MSSDDTGNDQASSSSGNATRSTATVELMLFDSLVHHLIEKGVLTKNDALSVVQTVAEVLRGRIEGQSTSPQTTAALALLERTYSSFEALADRHGAKRLDGHNVQSLRPPLHAERPKFPSDD